MDFRCTKVHNDFLIAVGSSSGFWFVGWDFYVLVLCLDVLCLSFFSRSCCSFDLFDVAGII